MEMIQILFNEFSWNFAKKNHIPQILKSLVNHHENNFQLLINIIQKNIPKFSFENSNYDQYSGIQNSAKNCFMNAILQQLFFIEEFRMQIKSLDIDNKKHPVLYHLQNIFSKLSQKENMTINISEFLQEHFKYDSTMINNQQDAHEFLLVLFSQIENSLKEMNCQNFIEEIFRGKLNDYIKCIPNNHITNNIENYHVIDVDVKTHNSLEESLMYFISDTQLDGDNKYFCTKCQKKTSAIKKYSFQKLPKILIFILKRFDYDFKSNERFRMDSYFTFPLKLVMDSYIYNQQETMQSKNKNRYIYNLIGIVIHQGSAEFGHYISLIKKQSSDPNQNVQKWIKFNDSKISHFNINNLQQYAFGNMDKKKSNGRSAYMLFYQLDSTSNHEKQHEKQEYSTQFPQDEINLEFFSSLEFLDFFAEIQKNIYMFDFSEKTQLTTQIATQIYFEIIPNFDDKVCQHWENILILIYSKYQQLLKWIFSFLSQPNCTWFKQLFFNGNQVASKRFVLFLSALMKVSISSSQNGNLIIENNEPKEELIEFINFLIEKFDLAKNPNINPTFFFQIFLYFGQINLNTMKYLLFYQPSLIEKFASFLEEESQKQRKNLNQLKTLVHFVFILFQKHYELIYPKNKHSLLPIIQNKSNFFLLSMRFYSTGIEKAILYSCKKDGNMANNIIIICLIKASTFFTFSQFEYLRSQDIKTISCSSNT
ncbi:ubiquitin carboxyl-terminal hydrolase [Anaeramoeba ignava]|uniref:Ubiquitin carboxyl-terminal hydrolase n=1 Tax=Anaeramoeba ignava TaxID=1746090 RepID=A0A9Q0LF06_ANAIG|nr:ubiquitin carboxyl-terminal hydrolase [Anaeramoeba ignava]